MKSKHTIFATICFCLFITNSCGLLKKTSEKQKQSDTFTTLEIVKTNAKKRFYSPSEDDSLHKINFDIQLVDSFSMKDNIEYRKAQILDSIKLNSSENKTKYYKQTIYLLDSIENSHNEHIDDIIAYNYKYTETREFTQKIKISDNEITESLIIRSGSIFIDTDATPLRNFIYMGDEIKNMVLNPIENPDYYKKIDRDVIEHHDI